MIHSIATDEDDPTEDPRFGRVGKQKITDTGQLTSKRMELFDIDEVIPRALDFLDKAQSDDKPFFVWLNTSRMHLYTRLNDDWRYAAERYGSEADIHGSGMMQHDHDIGVILDFLDSSGLAEDTIVWYSTDNGPEHSSWPHGATTPFRGEKMTTFEGGIRVPSVLRWPGVSPERTVLNGIQHHSDMFVTLAAAAGVEGIADRVLEEKKQMLDEVDNLEYWKGDAEGSTRRYIFHYTESKLTAARMGPWKFHFSTAEDYYDSLHPRGKPLVFNLRMDPFEGWDNSDSYGHLVQKVSWLLAPMAELMRKHIATLVQYPPVQGGSSFDMSNIVEEYLTMAHE